MHDEEHRKKLAILIADIIHDLLQESDDLADVLEEAQKEGYDVFLTILSGIVIRRHDEKTSAADQETAVEFEFTESDKQFLASIGIQAPETDDDAAY